MRAGLCPLAPTQALGVTGQGWRRGGEGGAGIAERRLAPAHAALRGRSPQQRGRSLQRAASARNNVRDGITNLKQSQLTGKDKGLKLEMNGVPRAARL